MKKLLCLLTAALLFLSGCTVRAQAADLMDGVERREVSTWNVDRETADAIADFSLRLFQASNQEGENTLISPLSVLAALGMTANGAAGETRAQMEVAFGLSLLDVNNYFRTCCTPGEDDSLKMADAVWYNGACGFEPKQAFLQANADYYAAGAYRAPFDESTRKEINDWVKTHTDGMIPGILDEVPADAVIYLVNALAFRSAWYEPFEAENTKEGTFTREDGVEQTVAFMNRSNEDNYLENDLATGFVKYYDDRNYKFVALLPKKGVTVSELVASLDGETFEALMSSRFNNVEATVAMPKFKCEFSTELALALQAMGMTDAFSGEADFSAMGNVAQGDLFISRVLHKTYIEVDEEGTKAAAATAVEDRYGAGLLLEHKEVRLDRPFVYMILDSKNVPVFIGTLMDVG